MDMIRSVYQKSYSGNHLKHYTYLGSVCVSISPQVSKDAKPKACFIQTLEVCDLTMEDIKWCVSGALVQRPSGQQIGAGEGAKT